MLLSEYLGKNAKGDVGIEVEVEGKRLPTADLAGRFKFWSAIEDGSLRNGMEYIYRGATPIGKVGESIDELNHMFAKANSEISFSFRTSVHVHVNCLDLSLQQVKNFIYTYLVLEPLLSEFCGEIRKGNRFCLRLVDAEGILSTIADMFAQGDYASALAMIRQDQNRYAALNIQSLKEHGTLEVRSMQGTADKDTIVAWAETLVAIREYAKNAGSVSSIFNAIQKMGVVKFCKMVLGKYFNDFTYGGFEVDVMRNVSLTLELPYIKVKEVAVPKIVKPKFKLDNPLEMAAPIDWDEAVRQADRIAAAQVRIRLQRAPQAVEEDF